MSTEIMTISDAQVAAWTNMAIQKNDLTKILQGLELKAQQVLLPLSDCKDYVVLDAGLAAYRKDHLSMVDTRKDFTNKIEQGITQPLMTYEKRVDPKTNETYLGLCNLSLVLRKHESEEIKSVNAKAQESNDFKAHCSNQFYIVNEDLRTRLRKEINNQYQMHLRGKINPSVEEIKELLKAIKPITAAKFDSKSLSKEELLNIYMSFNKPDFLEIYNDAFRLLADTFQEFQNDLKDVESAIKIQQDIDDEAAKKATLELAEDVAINTLITQTEVVIIDTPKIKRTVEIVHENTVFWAALIMEAFIMNLPHTANLVRVKSWPNLTIGQMADVLGKLATTEGLVYEHLTLKDVEK